MYQSEYEQLIQETESLKVQTETVKAKVQKAETLLTGLTIERTRWSDALAILQTNKDNIIGDVLYASGFLSYVGFYS